MNEIKLAFLSSSRFENNCTIRGAVLVTDSNTKPLEFRVTSPIRPTAFQRTLYGEVLDEHILVELVAVPLLNSLKEKPKLIIVQESLFLDINQKQDIPIVRLFKDSEARFGKNTSVQEITCSSGKFETVLIETSKEKEENLPVIRKQLADIFAHKNLLEPFERIRLACEQVHNQKIGEG